MMHRPAGSYEWTFRNLLCPVVQIYHQVYPGRAG